MTIHNIKITNFKSIYGSQYFDFDNLKGLIKLSGPIGSGKTVVSEAIIYGLYGNVKGQNITNLVSWNCKSCEVEINLTSKDKEVYIHRATNMPLTVTINGKSLAGTSKRDVQAILEEEIFDVPKLAIIKMCIISFSQFSSLANMSPAETKQFLDDIFGFKIFSEYNNEIILERKNQQNEGIKLHAVFEDTKNQIDTLREKQSLKIKEYSTSVDIDALKKNKESLINEGIKIDREKTEFEKQLQTTIKDYDHQIAEYIKKISEVTALGKHERKYYDKIKSGICPTCGHEIEQEKIDSYKDKLDEYAKQYKEYEREKSNIEEQKKSKVDEIQYKVNECANNIVKIKQDIANINSELRSYEDIIKSIDENYETLIAEYEIKLQKIQQDIDKSDIEIGEWNEMNTLFSKTLRYNLLESLIPHINAAIQFYINKLEQPFSVSYDQELKAHIFVDSYDKEISYNNLSTGQKKTIDLAIIFGIIQNIMVNVNFNISFFDELFSNLDANSRNTMLSLLSESFSKDKTLFIVNHAEMDDEYFAHKIRVKIEPIKIKNIDKKKIDEYFIAKHSTYTLMF